MAKEKYIKHVYDPEDRKYLIGPLSKLVPSDRILQVIDSNAHITEMYVEDASTNITENPLTGTVDVTLKLSLKKDD